MIRIRPARKKDMEFVKALIRADRGLLQDEDTLPNWREFLVGEFKDPRKSRRIPGEIRCCCALKEFGKKFAEVRSFAFKNDDHKRLYCEILVRACLERADQRKIGQRLATIGEEEQELFARVGFEPPVKQQKFAMRKRILGLRSWPGLLIPGVKIIQARTDWHWEGIKRLARMFPKELIQPESPLFPRRRQFSIALAGNAVIGIAALTEFRRFGKVLEGEIRSVAVQPDFGHNRIGPKLVRHCESRAAKLGIIELFTFTGKREWFEKLDYRNEWGSEQAWFMNSAV